MPGAGSLRSWSGSVAPSRRDSAAVTCGTFGIADGVPGECPGAQEIKFTVPVRYNASKVLYQNLRAGRGDRIAVVGPAGNAATESLRKMRRVGAMPYFP